MARDLLYVQSHRHGWTYQGLCVGSHGPLGEVKMVRLQVRGGLEPKTCRSTVDYAKHQATRTPLVMNLAKKRSRRRRRRRRRMSVVLTHRRTIREKCKNKKATKRKKNRKRRKKTERNNCHLPCSRRQVSPRIPHARIMRCESNAIRSYYRAYYRPPNYIHNSVCGQMLYRFTFKSTLSWFLIINHIT